MTAEQKIKHMLLIWAADNGVKIPVPITAIDACVVDEVYDDLVEREEHWDAISETREGTVETNLECDWSRHYESKAVAAQYIDGSWVGWTYWYGGGKHGEPEAIDWMDSAYDLTCTEEEKTVIVRTFARTEEPSS